MSAPLSANEKREKDHLVKSLVTIIRWAGGEIPENKILDYPFGELLGVMIKNGITFDVKVDSRLMESLHEILRIGRAIR